VNAPALQRLLAELRSSGIADEKVLGAIAAVDRERFVSPTFAERAWDNTALPIAFGQTISQPLVVAAMTEALRVGPRMKVLEIGTGSGYQAAILSRLCKHVLTIERYRTLADRARERLERLGYHNIEVLFGDGFNVPAGGGDFERIIVTAAMEQIPDNLLQRLEVGGILIAPVGPHQGTQTLVRVVRRETGFERKELVEVRFVPALPGVAREL
jgi:protein-L-isoaspartate(D-aspartate) O-methyltransferase